MPALDRCRTSELTGPGGIGGPHKPLGGRVEVKPQPASLKAGQVMRVGTEGLGGQRQEMIAGE